jgi:hypothetical protein
VIKSGYIRWVEPAACKILFGGFGTTELLDKSSKGIDTEIDLKEKRENILDWIYLALNSEKWRALVNTVMNIRFS